MKKLQPGIPLIAAAIAAAFTLAGCGPSGSGGGGTEVKIGHVGPLTGGIAHLFNHQTHHRGQLTTLLSQLGIDPGVTDLPWLPGLISGKGSSPPEP